MSQEQTERVAVAPTPLQLAAVKGGDPLGCEAQGTKVFPRDYLHRPINFSPLDLDIRPAQTNAIKKAGVTEQSDIPFLPHRADNFPYQLFDLPFSLAPSLDDPFKHWLKARIARLNNLHPHPLVPSTPYPLYIRPEAGEFSFNMFITPIQVIDSGDLCLARSHQARQHKGDTSAQIRSHDWRP